MSSVIDHLHELGFSQYEAQAYLALLPRNPLSGYELAKISGIPRPNIYPVLQKLEERGAVLRTETNQGTQYAPVAVEELLQRLSSRFQAALDTARAALREIHTRQRETYIWNARGYPALLEHAQAVVAGVQRELLAAIWPAEASQLAAGFCQAEGRGIKVTTLCLANCPTECGGCRGSVHRYPVAPEQRNHWLVLIPDQRELLAGEILPSGEALAVRTCQKMLVDLAAWYIRHSVALAAILGDVDAQIEALLTPQTRATLQSVSPASAAGDWLDHMRQLLVAPDPGV